MDYDRDLSAIESLARESGIPKKVVAEIYSAERAKLDDTAKIKMYLGVLTSRRVRNILASYNDAGRGTPGTPNAHSSAARSQFPVRAAAS